MLKISSLIDNWPKTIALIVLTALLFWGFGCPAKTESLLINGRKVTRGELMIEFRTLTDTAEYRLADLDQQEAFRDIIFKNALLMVESGGLNPVGVITLLTSLYGLTRGAQDIKNKVKKKVDTS